MAGMTKQHDEAMAEMTEKTAAAAEACEQLEDAKHRASQSDSAAEKALQVLNSWPDAPTNVCHRPSLTRKS